MRIIHLFVLPIILLYPCIYASDTITTMLNNKKVVKLFPNGTWVYIVDTVSNSKKISGIPEKRKFSHPPFSEDGDYNLETKYDEFKDATIVKLELIISKEHDNKLMFYSFFYYKGKNLSTPTEILFGFHSFSEEWQYLRNSRLILMADEKRINLGELKRDGTVGEGYVIEHLSTMMPIEQFLGIINSKSVKGQLFTTEFKFTDDQLEAMREYASLMK